MSDDVDLYEIIEKVYDQEIHDTPLQMTNMLAMAEILLGKRKNLERPKRLKLAIMVSYFQNRLKLIEDSKTVHTNTEEQGNADFSNGQDR